VQSKETLKESFERDGYVAVRGFLNVDACAEVRRELERFIREGLPAIPPEQVYYENKDGPETLKQIQALQEHDDFFNRLMMNKAAPLARDLLGEDVVPKNMQYFNKPPYVGQPTPAHQDGFYFKLKPCRAVTMWMALEPVDHETGCIYYARESHKRGLRPHGKTGTLGFSQGLLDFPNDDDRANALSFPSDPGDLLAHHALTVHWASGNSSLTRSRQALGFIFYGESAREDEEAHGAYQEQLDREWKGAGKI